jgi:hypothetical protein
MAEFEVVRKYQKYHVYSNTGQLIMLTTQKKIADQYKNSEKLEDLLKKAVDQKSE